MGKTLGNDERFRINEYLEKTYGNKKGINSIALVKLTENNKYLFKQKKSVEGDLVVINLNRGFKFKNGHGHFSIMHMKDLEKLDNNEIIYCGCERCIAERDIDSISFLNQEGILSQSKFNGLFNREKYERLDIENTSNVEIIEEEEELPSNLSEEENESGNNIIEPIINDGHGVPQISSEPLNIDSREEKISTKLTEQDIETPDKVLNIVATVLTELIESDRNLEQSQSNSFVKGIKTALDIMLREYLINRLVFTSKSVYKLIDIIKMNHWSETGNMPLHVKHAVDSLKEDFKLSDYVLEEYKQNATLPTITMRSLVGVAWEVVESYQTEMRYRLFKEDIKYEESIIANRVLNKVISDLFGHSGFSLTGDLALSNSVNDLVRNINKLLIAKLKYERSRDVNYLINVDVIEHFFNEHEDDLIFGGIRETLLRTRRHVYEKRTIGKLKI